MGRSIVITFRPPATPWYDEENSGVRPVAPGMKVFVGLERGSLKPIGRKARKRIRINVRAVPNEFQGRWFARTVP